VANEFASIRAGRQFFLEIHDLLEPGEEPAVDSCQVEVLFVGEAGPERE
jgi:hypothetical protein